MGQSAKPVEKADPSPSVKDDAGDDDGPSNTPVAKGWSQSEIGGSSQADPWSGPGKARNQPNGKPEGVETPNPKPAGRGTPVKSAVKPAWGDTGDAKDWTSSELGLDDSVSQRGGGFKNAPSTEPGKKSWADQVEDGDEMDYVSGDEPAPVVAPAPDLGGDEDGESSGWVGSGKGKGKGKRKGKGKGKAKSVTGWSDVTNRGPW